MFSRFCFGVRLRGDKATITLIVHLGSLKPEAARQFINLNLLALQLDREDLWEALTGPRCSPFGCDHTHQQRLYSSHPQLPQTPTMPELLTLGLVLVLAQGGGPKAHLLSFLQATFLATENQPLVSHWHRGPR